MLGSIGALLLMSPCLASAMHLATRPRLCVGRTAHISCAASPVDATAVEATAQKIATCISDTLDRDWCEQADHARVGKEASRFYCEARAAGTDDVGQLLMAIGSGMQEVDLGDCFVGSWDIANMASDVIMDENYGAGFGSDCSCGGGAAPAESGDAAGR